MTRPVVLSIPAEVIASNLMFPEGPVVGPDGRLFVVEVARGTLTEIHADGSHTIAAELGGGPNGAALAADGSVLVANNGGAMTFAKRDGRWFAGPCPPTYVNGSI